MMKQERPEEPEVLKKKGEEWGWRYKNNREKNPAHQFTWPQVKGEKLNHILKIPLIEMTKQHCSYCDGYPLGKMGRQTIEHFKPKSKFPDLAFQWDNLFICCDVCQTEKDEEFDDLLLKPDMDDYDFFRYFQINFSTGEITPNPRAAEDDQQRAKKTIKLLGLNNSGLPGYRRRDFLHYSSWQDKEYEIDDLSYRFMFV